MTTDIKSRLSFMGKQLKEKLNQKQEAEEARNASPAESIALEPRELPPEEAAAMEASSERTLGTAEPAGEPATAFSEERTGAASEDAFEEAPAEFRARKAEAPETGTSGSLPSEPEEPPSSPPESEAPSRITDEELSVILLAFGWKVSADGQA